jgi:hypothetical protein
MDFDGVMNLEPNISCLGDFKPYPAPPSYWHTLTTYYSYSQTAILNYAMVRSDESQLFVGTSTKRGLWTT